MLRKIGFALVVLAIVVAGVLPLAAQDDMEGMIVCDSSTIMLFFLAEYHGYVPMEDTSNIERGQYAPLFESMMAMMDEEMMGEEEEMMESTEEAMMGEEEMMDDMMMLAPPVIEGEPAECTALREASEAYLYDYFSSDMMMDEMGGEG